MKPNDSGRGPSGTSEKDEVKDLWNRYEKQRLTGRRFGNITYGIFGVIGLAILLIGLWIVVFK